MRHDDTSATTTVAPNTPELLTAAEVAERLNVGRSTVYNLISAGRLTAYRFGKGKVRQRGIRVPEEAVTAFLAELEAPAAA